MSAPTVEELDSTQGGIATMELRQSATHAKVLEQRKYPTLLSQEEKKGVIRVFSNVRWRHVYPERHVFDNGKVIDFSKYGCTYEEWKKGVEPKTIPE